MRLTRNRMQKVVVRKPIPSDDVYAWADGGETILAIVQPMTTSARSDANILSNVYGERAIRMRILLYAGIMSLQPGMGFCVDVPGDSPCDFRAISVDKWTSHQEVIMEWIPEGRR